MTFPEWQQLGPDNAAREVHQRAARAFPGSQFQAALAVLRDEAALAGEFRHANRGGPLGGVPYLIKDMWDVPGWPTHAGSSFLAEVRPASSTPAGLVRELESAGAVLAGKTQLFEFAWGLTGENAHFGDCEHPRFPGRTAGGSSSGSAAAVAAGVVPFAIGTDTGGSVRVPASFCGIYGYRGVPHDDRISDGFPLAPSYDTVGWFTRNAADLRTAMDALVGLSPGERRPRGVYLDLPGVDPEVAAACRAAAGSLAAPADAASREQLLNAFAPAAEVYGLLAGAEGWKIHAGWAETYRERYGPLLRDRLDRSRQITEAQLIAVDPGRQVLLQAWIQYFVAFDFLVMPAVPCPALMREECTQANRLRMLKLTAPVSLAGLPSLVLPVKLPSGLSAGLQVVVSQPRSPAIPWVLEPARYGG